MGRQKETSGSSDSQRCLTRRTVYLQVGFVVLCFLVSCVVNFPGHYNYDTLVQLIEGRTLVYNSMNPPVMSALLGISDRIVTGTAVYFLVVNGIFYICFAIMSVIYKFAMATWIVLIVIFFLPVFLLLQGLLAKDILFANASLFGLCLLHVSRREGRWATASFWLASACLTLAVMARQQGSVVLLAGLAIILLSTPAAPGASETLRSRLKPAAIFLGAVMIEVIVANAAISMSAKGGPANVMAVGTKAIEFYDISGVYAHDKSVEFALLKKHGVEVGMLPAYIAANYGPDRWDRLENSNISYAWTILGLPLSVMTQQWLTIIVGHPLAYLQHRLDVFRYFMGFGDRSKCYYISNIGVPTDVTSAPLVAELHLQPYSPSLAQRLSSLTWSWRELVPLLSCLLFISFGNFADYVRQAPSVCSDIINTRGFANLYIFILLCQRCMRLQVCVFSHNSTVFYLVCTDITKAPRRR